MAAWLLLIFSLCLDNQLSSIHSIITYKREQMFEKYQQALRQSLVWFLSYTGKQFFLEVSF